MIKKSNIVLKMIITFLYKILLKDIYSVSFLFYNYKPIILYVNNYY